MQDRKTLGGPLAILDQDSKLTPQQQRMVFHSTGLWAKIFFKRAYGIWVGPRCTRQCRHVLAIGRRLSCPIDISRLLDEVRLLGYNPSDRRGLTRHVGSFQ